MASVAEIDGLTVSGVAPVVPAAAAAYSVRLLDSLLGTTYTGAAMRVRRETAGGAGDDDEADIAFDSGVISLDSAISNASDGVTATTLGQFLNVGTVNGTTYTNADSLTVTASCFTDTWYDQSGNANHAEQATPGRQPQIHIGTEDTDLILENGKPAMDCASDALVAPSVTLDSYYSWYYVAKPDASGGFIFEHSENSDPNNGAYNYLGINNSAEIYRNPSAATRNATAGGGYAGTSQTLIDWNYSGTWTAYKDGASLSIGSGQGDSGDIGDSSATDELNLFSRNESTLFFTGKFQEIVFWNDDQDSAGNRTTIEENINTEYLIYQPTDQPTSGLLYDYGSATGGTDAAAAYSVRQLSDKAILCMRIRRDMGAGNPGDDDEINIGFDANGDLDTQAIADFCTTGTGYVTRWWDQSVNGNHADQPVGGTGSNVNQPQIYNGTAVIEENSKPTLRFPNQEYLDTGLDTSSTDFDLPQTMYLATRIVSPSSFNNLTFQIGGSPSFSLGKFNMIAGENDNTTSVQYRTGTAVTESVSSYTDTEMYLLGGYWQASSLKAAYNGAALSTGSSISEGDFSNNDLWIGGTGTTSNGEFNISEFLVWPSDQSSNKSGIETDINTYFSIYT